MKERRKQTGLWIDRAQVGALAAIAEGTGECKIVSSCCASVLLCDNVLALERRKRHLFWKAAVLTATGRAIEYQLTECHANVGAAHDCCACCLAACALA